MKIIEKDTKIVGNGKSVLYANGRYYLLSEKPAKVCYSEDLENWTEIELNDEYLAPKHLAYGNGIFIITGGAGTTSNTYYYYSFDGINFIPRIINTGLSFSTHSSNCKFINNRFVFDAGYIKSISGKQTAEVWQLFETTDGVHITKHKHEFPTSIPMSIMDIEFHNGIYVLIGCSGMIFTSTDLNNWVQRTSGTKLKLVGISYGKGQFVITGEEGIILTSSNGYDWVRQESETDSYLIRSHYSNGMYIAVGYNGTILQSIDGVSWKNISDKNRGLRYGLTVNDNRFVISATRYTATGTIPIYYFDITRNLSDESEDSSLFFFDKKLNMLGIIDNFISMRWRRKYFEAGEFEIILPITEYIMNIINTDVLIMRNNYTEVAIIETIEFIDDGTDEELKISGRFLSSLLERRIIKNKINFSGNTIEGMNTIVNSLTPLSDIWETETVTFNSKHIEFQCTYKNAYQYLCKLSEYANIGFRIVANVDSKVFMFEVYEGKDRTVNQTVNEQYSFSNDRYNIEHGTLVISNKTKINYVLVGGQGEDSSRIMQEIKTQATGFDLHETFSDQKSLSKTGLTDMEYKEKLKTVGEAKLNDGTFKLEVTALVQKDYKTKWDLGDVVNIKKEKWNVYTEYRIIEVEEIIEDGKRTIYPTFGSPLSSAWNED